MQQLDSNFTFEDLLWLGLYLMTPSQSMALSFASTVPDYVQSMHSNCGLAILLQPVPFIFCSLSHSKYYPRYVWQLDADGVVSCSMPIVSTALSCLTLC